MNELKHITNDNTSITSVLDAHNFRTGRSHKLNTYDLATYIIDKYHVINLHGMLYIYDNGIYVRDSKLITQYVLRLSSGASPAEIKKVFADLSILAPARIETNYKLVAFNNCIVNIDTLQTFEFSPTEYVITSKVYANYDTNILQVGSPAVEFVKSFFDVICNNDSGLKTLLFEIIGYCMLRTAKHQYGIILKGTSNNGKSDYLHIIDHLLHSYCSHQTFEQLSKVKNLMALYDCTANIVDDKREVKRVDFSIIQSIVSGGNIGISVNETEEFSFAPYSTLIVATNHYLNFRGCHKELMRRFLIVPFVANLDKCRDIDMTENICSPEHLDVIATLAIQAYSKVVHDKDFHIPEVVSSCTTTFYLQANPVLEFVKSHPIHRLLSKSDYFDEFCRWCNRHNISYTEVSSTFGTQVIDYGYEPKPHRIDGINDTYYQVLGYNIQDLKSEYEVYCNSLDNSTTPMKLSQFIVYLYKQDIKDAN